MKAERRHFLPSQLPSMIHNVIAQIAGHVTNQFLPQTRTNEMYRFLSHVTEGMATSLL